VSILHLSHELYIASAESAGDVTVWDIDTLEPKMKVVIAFKTRQMHREEEEVSCLSARGGVLYCGLVGG
jgi:hypothetical protein